MFKKVIEDKNTPFDAIFEIETMISCVVKIEKFKKVINQTSLTDIIKMIPYYLQQTENLIPGYDENLAEKTLNMVGNLTKITTKFIVDF